MGEISLFWLTGDLRIHADPMVVRILDFHLQVEESLVELIESFLRDAKQVKLDRLSFAAKVNWARALVGPQEKDEIWELALKLNALRNSVAHRTPRAPQEKHDELEAELRRLVPEIQLREQDAAVFYAALACIKFFREIVPSPK
jgi:hypothetical protein